MTDKRLKMQALKFKRQRNDARKIAKHNYDAAAVFRDKLRQSQILACQYYYKLEAANREIKELKEGIKSLDDSLEYVYDDQYKDYHDLSLNEFIMIIPRWIKEKEATNAS